MGLRLSSGMASLDETLDILKRQKAHVPLLVIPGVPAGEVRHPYLTYSPKPEQVSPVGDCLHVMFYQADFPVYQCVLRPRRHDLLDLDLPDVEQRQIPMGWANASVLIVPGDGAHVGTADIFEELKRQYDGIFRTTYLEVARRYYAALEAAASRKPGSSA